MELINQILGWIIILGTFVTYGFQYHKLYICKNVVGINDNMLILGCFSSVFNLMGIIGDNINKIDNKNTYYQVLPIIQIFSPWICLEINYLMYYIYETNKFKKKKGIIMTISLFTCLLIFFPVSIYLFSSNYNSIADTLNVISAILSVCMWIPQIITTFKDKNEGSLSLISLGCHSSGCLLVIIFQILEKQAFSVILPYIIAFICESWLVLYCLYIKWKIKKSMPLLNDYN